MSNEILEAQKEKATKTLGVMLDYLSLEAELHTEERNGKIAIRITSPDAGRIIGRNGQTLEGLQYLLNLVLFKGDATCPRIMLDIDGYARGNRRGERGERGDREGAAPERSTDRRDRTMRTADEGEDSATEEQLRCQALDAAKEVRRWGESVRLPKMNARDRRIIHLTLQEEADIVTQSEGEGNRKEVVVSLKKD
ncbi:MAG: KH domain-containing protein [Victivallaceae bacterium]|nr:KH domain-containing protein [Victivallaceae bacterium]